MASSNSFSGMSLGSFNRVMAYFVRAGVNNGKDVRRRPPPVLREGVEDDGKEGGEGGRRESPLVCSIAAAVNMFDTSTASVPSGICCVEGAGVVGGGGRGRGGAPLFALLMILDSSCDR
jgi:hypothetical protein